LRGKGYGIGDEEGDGVDAPQSRVSLPPRGVEYLGGQRRWVDLRGGGGAAKHVWPPHIAAQGKGKHCVIMDRYIDCLFFPLARNSVALHMI